MKQITRRDIEIEDSLGVPAEFKSRRNMKENPITDMIGYGTHNQPDYALLMDKFSNWLMCSDYTPYGEVFDCGISTSRVIKRYAKGRPALECGGKADWENELFHLYKIMVELDKAISREA